ncbi:unnamed protein product, partial [Phaeothamnion confervicola]
ACAPSRGHSLVMEAVMILLSPVRQPLQPPPPAAVAGIAWREARRLLQAPAVLAERVKSVDMWTVPPGNVMALEAYLAHPAWP